VPGWRALVLHGLDRLTAYVDLVMDLSAESTLAAIHALTVAGYRHRATSSEDPELNP
jgi:hypothetical protein